MTIPDPSSLSLRERIAQCVMAPVGGVPGAVAERDVAVARKAVADLGVGGLCMFEGSVSETPALLNSLQEAARWPLLVASDLEAGAGQHLKGATPFPSAMAVGACGSGAERLAERMGRITAREARACGVHLIFAPVADCLLAAGNPIINTRAFGDDPERVGRCAAAFTRGVLAGGALPTLKHFPGHGGTVADSHTELPALRFDRKQWESEEGLAFRLALEADPPAVMMGHLSWPAVDPDWPTSLSERVIRGLLRDGLGFQGVVCTDALMMGAIADRYDEETIGVQALRAGVDLLLYPRDPKRMIDGIEGAVREGRLPEAVVDGAVSRILALKKRLGLFDERQVAIPSPAGKAAAPEASAAAVEIARSAWTFLRDGGNRPGLWADSSGLLVWRVVDDPYASHGDVFLSAVRERVPPCEEAMVRPETAAARLMALRTRMLPPQRLIVAIFSKVRAWKGRAGLDPRLIEAIRSAVDVAPDAMAVSFGSPFLSRDLPEIPTFACTYAEDPASQRAAAEGLFGRIPAPGRCPVRIHSGVPAAP